MSKLRDKVIAVMLEAAAQRGDRKRVAYYEEVDAAIALVLEEAARVADEYSGDGMQWDNAAVACNEIADAIRAMRGPFDVQQA